ncbi:RluA family pseudouridine synthase [Patescibacteria group bacterium]|nr:RluA family pseudouridine synthase [Patescibacteria group bacterium]
MKINIKEQDNNLRLDKYLNKVLKDKSRSQIQKMIKAGAVLVNQKQVLPHHFIKTNDEIVFVDEPTKTTDDTEQIKPTMIEPKLIFECKDYVVLEKPIGLLVHPTDKKETNTLADWLKEKYPKILTVGEEKYRAGIIHRLDRNVSGIMLACKTQKMYDHLKTQFKDRSVLKEYTALVHGMMEQEVGEIDTPIGRKHDSYKMAAHPRDHGKKLKEKDKVALTKYEVVERIKNFTLIKVIIKTGRTHQIRVHLNSIGHPIAGDPIYKVNKFWKVWQKKSQLDRIFLHATKIGFNDINDNWQIYEISLPNILKNYLDEIKG